MANAKRKYLFFDYDGTLRSRKLDRIPESTLRALELLRQNGHFLALATGRLQMDALGTMSLCGMDTMVADGGNSITINGELVWMEGMPGQQVRGVLHWLDQHDMPWAVTTVNQRVCYAPDQRYRDAIEYCYYDAQVDSALCIDELDEVYKIFVPCPPGHEHLVDSHGLTWVRYDTQQMIFEPDDKAQGIRKMMQLVDGDIADVVTFGDGKNDLRMFSPEWTNVAMGNAIPPLKQRATMVTTSVDDDGIWNACRELGLI